MIAFYWFWKWINFKFLYLNGTAFRHDFLGNSQGILMFVLCYWVWEEIVILWNISLRHFWKILILRWPGNGLDSRTALEKNFLQGWLENKIVEEYIWMGVVQENLNFDSAVQAYAWFWLKLGSKRRGNMNFWYEKDFNSSRYL